mmetsp:Transcript_2100/g.4170  ORF Transcript_2100/g.4170 Transcript_2100/m.4170 type:complete len:277 (+) Transcript_2100:1266-2096(+)
MAAAACFATVEAASRSKSESFFPDAFLLATSSAAIFSGADSFIFSSSAVCLSTTALGVTLFLADSVFLVSTLPNACCTAAFSSNTWSAASFPFAALCSAFWTASLTAAAIFFSASSTTLSPSSSVASSVTISAFACAAALRAALGDWRSTSAMSAFSSRLLCSILSSSSGDAASTCSAKAFSLVSCTTFFRAVRRFACDLFSASCRSKTCFPPSAFSATFLLCFAALCLCCFEGVVLAAAFLAAAVFSILLFSSSSSFSTATFLEAALLIAAAATF